MPKNTPLADLQPRRILVCQLKQIGDVILATPTIQLLKQRWPQSQIHVLTEAKCAPVLEHHPDIHTIWPIDKQALRPLWKAVAYYRRVAQQGFDLIVDLQQLPRCKYVVVLSRARVRLTYPPPWYNRPLYTHWTEPQHGYAARYKASFLAPLGITWDGARPRMSLTEQERAWAAAFVRDKGLGEHEKLIVAAPGHKAANRRWPAANYGELIRLAGRARPDWKWLLVYGPGERETAEAVCQAAGDGAAVLPLEDVYDLRRIAALIQRADMFVGNCSAPRHMAVAVDTPSLAVLGASSTAWTFPAPEHQDIALGMSCQPCNQEGCSLKDVPCLRDVSAELVWNRLREQVEQSR